jgi:hypothetical protein
MIELLGAFVVVGLVNAVLTMAVMAERIDVSAKDDPLTGPSWFWQLNVLLHASVTRRGKLMRILWVLGTITQIILLVCIVRAA